MPTKLLKFYLLSTLMLTAHSAGGAPALCSHIFDLNLQSSQDLLPSQITYSANYFNSRNPTVSVRLLADGKNEVLKIGDSWYSSYSKEINDTQGDPRWFSHIFGDFVAGNFGFQSKGQDIYVLPSVAQVNRELKSLDQKLESKGYSKTSIKFYETSESTFEGLAYLKKFAQESSLPVSHTGHLAVHDWSYHGAAILIPKDVLSFTQNKAQLAISLHEFTYGDAKKNLSPAEHQILAEATDLALQSMVEVIDFGTGNIGFGLIARRLYGSSIFPNKKLTNSVFADATWNYLIDKSEKYTSQEILKSSVRHHYSFLPPHKQKEVRLEKIENELSRFYVTQKPMSPLNKKLSRESFLSEIETRILQVLSTYKDSK